MPMVNEIFLTDGPAKGMVLGLRGPATGYPIWFVSLPAISTLEPSVRVEYRLRWPLERDDQGHVLYDWVKPPDHSTG